MSRHDLYQWPQGHQVAASLSFDFDGETPYLWRNRATPVNLLSEVEQRRFGPRIGVYRLLELLEKWGIRATFFVPGAIAELYPKAVEMISHLGHEIGMHGFIHERVDELTDEELDSTFLGARRALEDITRTPVIGYRSPSWEMTPAAFGILKKYNVAYDSSLMGYDHPYWIGGIPEIPVQWLLDDAVFYRYVGSGGHPPVNPGNVSETWLREYSGLREFGGLFLVTMHPWISGRASRVMALEQIIRSIKEHSDVWWATCSEIAQHHRSNYPNSYWEELSTGFSEESR